jgi:hypothetical protein
MTLSRLSYGEFDPSCVALNFRTSEEQTKLPLRKAGDRFHSWLPLCREPGPVRRSGFISETCQHMRRDPLDCRHNFSHLS